MNRRFIPFRARTPGRSRRRCFTLVELMVAMVILVLMMYLLFRFIGSAESAWSLTSASTQVYEKARIAFDLITRDLQCAVARPEDAPHSPNSNIYFFETGVSPNQQIAFVTCTTPAKNSSGHLSVTDFCNVGYELNNNELKRARMSSGSPAGTGSGWDLYTSTPSLSGYQTVIGGVLNAQFTCYNDAMQPKASWSDSSLPFAVSVTLTIMDDQSFTTWQHLSGAARTDLANKEARSFTKMVFLGDRRMPGS